MRPRDRLGDIYQKHYQTGVGAEIGTLRGEFAYKLSQRYRGKILCIDYFGGDECREYRPELEEKCRENLKGTNCDILKGFSLDIVKFIAEESLDWVYIDANHRYKHIKADLEAWFPKVRKGGIVSGHDYVNKRFAGYEFGVIKAVDEFCEKHGYEVNLIDPHKYASWYFIK